MGTSPKGKKKRSMENQPTNQPTNPTELFTQRTFNIHTHRDGTHIYEKIWCVCGEHFISINFPPRKWKGYYAYL